MFSGSLKEQLNELLNSTLAKLKRVGCGSHFRKGSGQTGEDLVGQNQLFFFPKMCFEGQCMSQAVSLRPMFWQRGVEHVRKWAVPLPLLHAREFRRKFYGYNVRF
jgi:hypothetical protein